MLKLSSRRPFFRPGRPIRRFEQASKQRVRDGEADRCNRPNKAETQQTAMYLLHLSRAIVVDGR